MKKVGRTSLGLVLEWGTRRHQSKDQIIDPNGKRFVAVNLSACGENVGLADAAEAAALTYLCQEGVGLAEKLIKIIPREHPEPGEYPYRKQLYVHSPTAGSSRSRTSRAPGSAGSPPAPRPP